MQSETESMKNDIETYKSKLESAQAEAGAARQECQIARSQLHHLKKSNESNASICEANDQEQKESEQDSPKSKSSRGCVCGVSYKTAKIVIKKTLLIFQNKR